MMNIQKKEIVKKTVNPDRWYTDVILKAELADYAPVKGFMVIRPYGFALWEKVQEFLGGMIKEKGIQNAYFPVLIPEHFLKKEKEHVEGFSPQFAVVTEAGGENLAERLIVRPTSETVMYEMYKQWTQSWRDLPILINQWNNIVRWEKRTYLFLRTSEFLWQEGHCAHTTHEESLNMVLWALDSYRKTYNGLFGMYGVIGVKSNSEKFAGADKTYSFEMLMPDGKALQGATSHDLGQNFAKAFDWTVSGKRGENLYPFQNSWGFSTRSIGGLVMVCGDDDGLVLPPSIAPVQVVIIPIPGSPAGVYKIASRLDETLKKERIRVITDDRSEETAGFKYNKWEMKGVPLRIELGSREVESGTVTVARRDTGQKATYQLTDIIKTIGKLIQDIQESSLARHKKFTLENTRVVDTYGDFKDIMKTSKGFIRSLWCEDSICEAKIKEETKASTRVLPLDTREENGKCIYCGKHAIHRWYFAQAY